MAGGATLYQESASSESDQPDMPFRFYEGVEVSASVYAKIAFTIFYRCPILVFLGSLLYFSSSTSTGTGKSDELVALGVAQ